MRRYPARHNRDECVKRGDARHFILFVLVSLLVYNDNGLHLFSPWKLGDQEVAGDAADTVTAHCEEGCRNEPSYFYFFFGGGGLLCLCGFFVLI